MPRKAKKLKELKDIFEDISEIATPFRLATTLLVIIGNFIRIS